MDAAGASELRNGNRRLEMTPEPALPVAVPLVLIVEPGLRDVPVSSIDIAPTILAACGLEVPSSWRGVDLRSVAAERGPMHGAAFTHDIVDIDVPARSLLSRWVLRDPYKLHVHTDPQQPLELYNVRTDPGEERPLDDKETVDALRSELDGWWAGTNR